MTMMEKGEVARTYPTQPKPEWNAALGVKIISLSDSMLPARR
jgi:hypothetical protein